MKTNAWVGALRWIGCLVLSTPALAGDLFTCVTDTRRCTAAYTGNGSATTTTSRPAPAEPFEGAANLEVSTGLETWVTLGEQLSDIGGASMSFDGASTVLALASPLSPPLQVLGQSKFDVFFNVDGALEYTLEGRVSESGHESSIGRVVLSLYAPGDPVIESIVTDPESTLEFRRTGTLQPGMYRLAAEASALGRTTPPEAASEGQASCRFVFTVATSARPAAPTGTWTAASTRWTCSTSSRPSWVGAPTSTPTAAPTRWTSLTSCWRSWAGADSSIEQDGSSAGVQVAVSCVNRRTPTAIVVRPLGWARNAAARFLTAALPFLG